LAKPGSIAGRLNNAEPNAPVPLGTRALPPEAPREMPRARLHGRPKPLRATRSVWFAVKVFLARLYVGGGTAALTAFGVSEMYGVLGTVGLTPLQWAFLAVFAVNFTWVSFALVQASLGFFRHLWQSWRRRSRVPNAPSIRTAILVPVYNEDPAPVADAIRAMAGPLAEAAPDRFAVFILSDTNRAEAWVTEEERFRDLCLSAPEGCPIYYRRRKDNVERKAGNIAEWVGRWGGTYEAMLILDADSVIAPETIMGMAGRLEADPGLGLLQTLPSIFGAKTLYARLQQFANRCYGPIFANGLAAWHGLSGNYWGHNAIIRTRAFAESCRLPELPGAPPLGGHILSHDFVEAALLRRAGWGVRFDTDLEGSYEQAPPSLVDTMIRDRRWCQGNMQHARVLFARGLRWTSRLHLLSGVMSYLTALLWLVLILLGLALATQAALIRPEYFTEPSLFPTWPVFDSERAISLFAVSMAVVLAPKLLGCLAAVFDLRRFTAFGGPIVLTWSVFVEMILSALYAPVLMITQARDICATLIGRDSGWTPQRRNGGGMKLAEHIRRNRAATVVGVTMAGIAWTLNTDLFLWLLPVTAGLILSVPLSWISERRGPARALAVFGILSTPEERHPPPVLEGLASGEDPAAVPPAHPLRRLRDDPALCRWHAAQLASPVEEGRNGFDPEMITGLAKVDRAPDFETLIEWLSPTETLALLRYRPFIEGLSRTERATVA